MRFNGTLTQWIDDRGFGFITPDQGGQEIFVHIKAFDGQTARPQMGQVLSFDIELGADGKKRAKRVFPAKILLEAQQNERDKRQNPRPGAISRRPPAGAKRKTALKPETAGFYTVAGFVLLYLWVAWFWRVPTWIAAAYLSASLLTFMAYAFDKSAASAGRWRTRESTLLLLGLVGGWPGAIFAQQLLRHKSTKTSFRSAFWITVITNVGIFLLFYTPLRLKVLGLSAVTG